MSDGPITGAQEQQPEPESLVGQILDGRYRILKLIGEGGMGQVYSAEHIHIEKKFAIKLLKSEIVSNQEAVQRFRQEARSSSTIGHRNIIAIDDFGQLPDGRIYMCMELLNGAALNDLIQQPIPAQRLLDILIQTGQGLAAAHAKGIVHRDMKPENIFVTIGPNGEDIPKILDFGIAKVSLNEGQNHLTRTGTIFGTPFYMAPEQALGNAIDTRADIYSMGVIMYECFAGSLPFQGESFMGILTQHITSEAEPVEQRAAKAGRMLPPGLAEVIGRCMRKNPAERFASMDELVAALVPIYRGVAGPGASAYMPAFTGGSAPHLSQPTPPGYPPTGPYQIAPPTGGYQVPPTGPQAAASPSGAYAAPAPKSKTGLVVGIIAVLAIGGGIGAFAIVGGGNSDKAGAGSGSAIAEGVGTGSAIAENSHGTHDPVVADRAGSAIADRAGSAIADRAGSDHADAAGSDHADAAGSGTLPVATAIEVVIEVPPRAQIFDETGAMVGTNPYISHIAPGTPHTYTVKLHGYHDKTLVVDGTQTSYVVSLAAIGGGNSANPKPHQTTPGPGNHNPPPPSKLDCTRRLVNPADQNCQRQYCVTHQSDPTCSMED